MDIFLLAITVVSLLVALVMSATALRFGRAERARSAARVAALAAAAGNDDAAPVTTPVSVSTPVALAPLAVPAVKAVAVEPIAVNEPRPWAPARISTFSPRPNVADDLPLMTAPLSEAFLGSALAQPASGGRQRGLAIAALFLFVALVAGGYWSVFGDKTTGVSAAPAAADNSPLELVSLRHERRGPRLAVTGLVRNPVVGVPVDRLAAVVFLFDQQGGFIKSARADIDFVKLTPGDESPFVIDVDAPSSVARYRVSFRNQAGVVPHVDRRGQQPIAATGAIR